MPESRQSRMLRPLIGVVILCLLEACGDPTPSDEGLRASLHVGPGTPPWGDLFENDALDMELGFQGLLMLPITLRLNGDAAPLAGDELSVEIRLSGTDQLLSRQIDEPDDWTSIEPGVWQSERIELISTENDPAVLQERSVELLVGLRHSSDDEAYASLRRTLRLRNPLIRPECAFQDSATSPTAPLFTDVTVAAGLVHHHGELNPAADCLLKTTPGGETALCGPERASGAVAVGDYDEDGWPDLYFTSPTDVDHLYRNLGNGTFTDVTLAAGLDGLRPTSGASWADVDDDGDLDLYLSSIGENHHYLFINDGLGTFADETASRGAGIASAAPHAGMSIAVGDYDRDGYVDLFVGEWMAESALGGAPHHARLLRNAGASSPGHFLDVTDTAGVDAGNLPTNSDREKGIYVHAPSFVDLDADGWPELSLASDFGTSRLFWNRGDGSFSDGTRTANVGTDGFGMGSAFGDYDGDGDLDWFVSSITRLCNITEDQGNRLYLYEGDRQFSDATDEAAVFHGGWGWGALPFDLENDGDVDILHVAGTFTPLQEYAPMRLFRNGGGFPFSEIAAESGLNDLGQGRGVATLDYDRDGDLDLVVARNAATPLLYRNDDASGNHHLRVMLVGDETNSLGLGARLTLQVSDGEPPQIREMGVGGHYMGQSESIAHFGLGQGTAPLLELRVFWPGSGRTTVLRDVARDQLLVLEEPDA